MATHSVMHPMKGRATINLGRYKTFTVNWSSGGGVLVPNVYPTDKWDEFAASVESEGGHITQVAWVTPYILLQPNPDDPRMGWRCGCEATFNSVTIDCCGDGHTPKEAQAAFWSNWNKDRRAEHTPTHLAILLPKRYRVVMSS